MVEKLSDHDDDEQLDQTFMRSFPSDRNPGRPSKEKRKVSARQLKTRAGQLLASGQPRQFVSAS